MNAKVCNLVISWQLIYLLRIIRSSLIITRTHQDSKRVSQSAPIFCAWTNGSTSLSKRQYVYALMVTPIRKNDGSCMTNAFTKAGYGAIRVGLLTMPHRGFELIAQQMSQKLVLLLNYTK